jgi:hypothetical protein
VGYITLSSMAPASWTDSPRVRDQGGARSPPRRYTRDAFDQSRTFGPAQLVDIGRATTSSVVSPMLSRSLAFSL